MLACLKVRIVAIFRMEQSAREWTYPFIAVIPRPSKPGSKLIHSGWAYPRCRGGWKKGGGKLSGNRKPCGSNVV